MACLACLPAHASAQERIAEILVHGNHTTPNEEILTLAGLAVGGAATEEVLGQARERLEQTGRFDAVEVRRRFRSIADPDEILVILLVDERVRGSGLWMPIVSHHDGYGLTYGARASFIDPLGPRTRLSVPMTWGGERRVAAELERTFEGGPVTTLAGAVSWSRHVNPHFRQTDVRRELTIHGERVLRPWLRASASARVSEVTFGGTDARHTAAGGHVTIDTRQDPSFPRDAVHATAGWERITVRLKPDATIDQSAGRWLADLRGYAGIVGPVVLAVRGQAALADAPLPASEQPLVGGGESLRGYRAGHRVGDSMATLSAEVRVPLTSALLVGRRAGVRAFVDTAAAWPHGASIRRQQFDRGIGAGIFFGAALVTAGADIAWPERSKPRVILQLTIGPEA